MTKSVQPAALVASVAMLLTACGEGSLRQTAVETPIQDLRIVEPAAAPGADAIRALAEEVGRLRAQIAEMQAAKAAQVAFVEEMDDEVEAPADGGAAPPPAPVADHAPEPAIQNVVVERTSLIERVTPVYIDREVPVYVEQEVPVYVDRTIVVEQPVLFVRDDCRPCGDDLFVTIDGGRRGHYGGRRGDIHRDGDSGRSAPDPEVRDAPAPSAPPVGGAPRPRVRRTVERAPAPAMLPQAPQPAPPVVDVATREPVDPPPVVVVAQPVEVASPPPVVVAPPPRREPRPRRVVVREEPAPLPAPAPVPPPVVKSEPVAAPTPAPPPPPPPPPPAPKKNKKQK